MEQKLEEVQKENNEQADEYFEFIRSAVDDGSYFKDARDWYFFRYVTPICDRTLLIFGAMIAAVVLYFLIGMVKSAFPLVEHAPVFIKAQDKSRYFPNLVELKPKKGERNYDQSITTIDEAVAKYLISTYIKDREGYDFSKAEIEDVNQKFNRIKNTSSASEYKNFQLVMSKDNPTSSIHQFGQNINKTITIESVRLIKKEPKNFTQKAREFLSSKLPTEAEVRFIATTKSTNEEGDVKNEKERYVAKVNFDFDGVVKGESAVSVLKFTVNNYQLFKIK
jgi:type IV secretion system protein VirB8